MKFRKLLLTTFALASLSLVSACSTNSSESVGKNAQTRTNYCGIYTFEEGVYTHVNPATAHVTPDDFGNMELPTGNKTTWLWGLITYTEY